MGAYLGLDIGTTHITALALDIGSGDVLATYSLRNASEITSVADKARGRSEWDAKEMLHLAWEAIHRTVRKMTQATGIEGLGVCGQMHGMCIVSAESQPITPFIGWQDQRGLELTYHGASTYVDRANELAESEGAKLATGYMGLSLFWLKETGFSFPGRAIACLIPDLAVAWLTGEPVCTDATNAGSSGLFDERNSAWHHATISRLGLPAGLLPPLRRAPSVAGVLRKELAKSLGLPAGIPISVAPDTQETPDVDCVDNLCMVVWLDSRTSAQTRSDVYAARFDIDTGEVLDDIAVTTRTSSEAYPSVGCSGSTCLVAFTCHRISNDIFGARVDLRTGQVLDPFPTDLWITLVNWDAQRSSVDCNGDLCAVLWEDYRSFNWNIYGTRIDLRDGSNLDGRDRGIAFSTQSDGEFAPKVDCPGPMCLVAWDASRARAVRFELASGTVLDGAPADALKLSTHPLGHSGPQTGCNSSVCLVVWGDGREDGDNLQVYGRFVGLDGRILGGELPITQGAPSVGSLATAAGSDGYWLVAYAYTHPDHDRKRVFARSVTALPVGAVCDQPDECLAGTCTDGRCPDVTPCGSDDDCLEGGVCADWLCCDDPCESACMACSIAAGGRWTRAAHW